jgi:hypothetical protein
MKKEPPMLVTQGLSLPVPAGWEARIRLATAHEEGAALFPVVHAASVPLPADRADYGGGVVERLRADDVFVAIVEFGAEAANSNLYPEVERLPRIDASMFHPFRLQRRIAGQAGTQAFFTLKGRAFCIYVVIGSFARRVELARKASEIIAGLSIAPRS